ncbi:MAG: hypothetical protein IIU94_03780, partial [Alistipes sp.]|nr:hypothetical protein [Alistipes sp.]
AAAAPNACVLISSALSGGTLEHRLTQALSRFGPERTVLALERAAEGYGVTFVDPSPAVARRVKQLLEVNDLLCEAGHSPQHQFVTFADEVYRDRLEQKAADTMEPISRVI